MASTPNEPHHQSTAFSDESAPTEELPSTKTRPEYVTNATSQLGATQDRAQADAKENDAHHPRSPQSAPTQTNSLAETVSSNESFPSLGPSLLEPGFPGPSRRKSDSLVLVTAPGFGAHPRTQRRFSLQSVKDQGKSPQLDAVRESPERGRSKQRMRHSSADRNSRRSGASQITQRKRRKHIEDVVGRGPPLIEDHESAVSREASVEGPGTRHLTGEQLYLILSGESHDVVDQDGKLRGKLVPPNEALDLDRPRRRSGAVSRPESDDFPHYDVYAHRTPPEQRKVEPRRSMEKASPLQPVMRNASSVGTLVGKIVSPRSRRSSLESPQQTEQLRQLQQRDDGNADPIPERPSRNPDPSTVSGPDGDNRASIDTVIHQEPDSPYPYYPNRYSNNHSAAATAAAALTIRPTNLEVDLSRSGRSDSLTQRQAADAQAAAVKAAKTSIDYTVKPSQLIQPDVVKPVFPKTPHPNALPAANTNPNLHRPDVFSAKRQPSPSLATRFLRSHTTPTLYSRESHHLNSSESHPEGRWRWENVHPPVHQRSRTRWPTPARDSAARGSSDMDSVPMSSEYNRRRRSGGQRRSKDANVDADYAQRAGGRVGRGRPSQRNASYSTGGTAGTDATRGPRGEAGSGNGSGGEMSGAVHGKQGKRERAKARLRRFGRRVKNALRLAKHRPGGLPTYGGSSPGIIMLPP